MKSVSYNSYKKLDCGCRTDVIVCVNSALTATIQPFILATVAYINAILTSGKWVYQYSFTYDEAQLLDPTYLITECDIKGVLCKGCLTDYIDYRIAVAGKGVTASRPSDPFVGQMYLDTTLVPIGLPIWWNGADWIKYDGTVV